MGQSIAEPVRTVRTACTFDCFDACGVLAEVRDGRITRLRGDPAHPFTRGALCWKTNHYLEERYYSAERITSPLRRTAEGWQRISWDEALALAAERLAAVRERYDSRAVLFHRGNGSMASLHDIMLERFFNLFGGATQAVGRYCAGEGDYGLGQSFGASRIHDPLDLAEHSGSILLWGRNPAVTNIHLMPVLKQVRARGGRVVLIDPVRTKTADYCDRAIHPRPGSDGWLALGMAKLILQHRPPDRARLAAQSERLSAYLELVERTSLDAVVQRTDLSLATIEELALTYADARPSAILLGVGAQQYTRGGQSFRLIAALGMLTGQVGQPGGGVSFLHWPWRQLARPVAADARTAPRRTAPISKLAETLHTLDDPPIRAAFFLGSNAVNQMPDPGSARAALAALDFVICVDQFLTDTADCANLFLPSASFLETEDLLVSYGHHWIQLVQPVVPPLGESRTDLEILQGLAERLGFGPAMAGSAAEWIDRISEPLRGQGISYAALRQAGGRLRPSDSQGVPFADGRFPTPSGKFVFPSSCDDEPVTPPAGYPLHLIAQASPAGVNSQLPEARQEGPIPADVHPSVAEALGLGDGDQADLVSPRGRLTVRLRLDPTLRSDLAVVAKGGWLKRGRNLNVLVEPRFTAGQGTAYNENFVRLEQCRPTGSG